jgi:hypothetical protein
MALGPAEIHPQQHLGPVGGLGAAGPGTDRQDRSTLVVLAGEQEGGALAPEVGLECCDLAIELGRQLGIARFLDQLEGREDIVGARLEPAP